MCFDISLDIIVEIANAETVFLFLYGEDGPIDNRHFQPVHFNDFKRFVKYARNIEKQPGIKVTKTEQSDIPPYSKVIKPGGLIEHHFGTKNTKPGKFKIHRNEADLPLAGGNKDLRIYLSAILLENQKCQTPYIFAVQHRAPKKYYLDVDGGEILHLIIDGEKLVCNTEDLNF